MTAPPSAALPYRYECEALVPASADRIFAHLDDHLRVSSHMSRRSWAMGGGRMDTQLDEGRGQEIGSHIRLAGRVLGLELSVEEVVTEHRPPRRKAWETIGEPRLLVIGHYRMGFELSPKTDGALLRVFIAYALPRSPSGRWLGRLFGGLYARWCTRQMLQDAVRHFAARSASGS